jgi:hypothetical protein
MRSRYASTSSLQVKAPLLNAVCAWSIVNSSIAIILKKVPKEVLEYYLKKIAQKEQSLRLFNNIKGFENLV